ncbi:DUF1294 domain-containing protein [Sulfurimonas paralvinellae]|uniref:DUF1294 domain-containing protein n=1 Tax=Sulfurimonas paralvinellae TaxID=317658 RepID=A0A7M1B8S2_9BACT|nr:DUF1294 domain-containing protein [Sulfurimonas paralvinellae]QOP46104.1 DUF1294 domain-containing protein [Sulfurimonas paralvinellae]
MQKVILFYFLFINLLAFLIYGYDKFIASKTKARRISERELHTFSIIGGFLGATLAMAIFHHKISKSSFLIKHIIILFLWIAGILCYFTQVDELNFLG